MPDIVAGKDVSLYALVDGDYIAIGCAASITFEYENELIPKTDVNAGLFRKKRVRISDFRASVNGLITLYNTVSKLSPIYFLQEAVRRAEQTIRIVLTDQGGVIRSIHGSFLVESEQLTGEADGIAEFDLSLEGTGGLSISEIESPTDPDCFDSESDWWVLNEGAATISGTGDGGKSFAGHEILEVIREMGPPLAATTGTPGDRQYKYDGTTIFIWADNPGNGNERIFVLWQKTV